MDGNPTPQLHGLALGIPPSAAPPASGSGSGHRLTPSSTTSARSNPISLRLWKVISTSANGGFDDPASMEALQIISERYCGPRESVVPVGKGDKASRKRQQSRKARDVGAHWLGADAVRMAGLAEEGRESYDDDTEPYWTSSDSDSSDDEGSSVSDLSIAGVVRPGILSRNQSSTTSIRSATIDASGDASSLALGATNAKKYFKRDLEAGLVEGSLRFLKAFEKVDDQLQVLRTHMQDMQDRCESVQAEMDKTNQGTSGLMKRANGLREQQQFTLIRQEISQLFLSRFTLMTEEITLLKNRELTPSAVGRPLFEIMDKVKRIRRDCRTLFEFVGAEVVVPSVSLGSGDGDTAGGEAVGERKGKADGEGVEGRDVSLVAKEIMATTTEHLEDAYEKLHRWVMFDFRRFLRDAQLEVSGVTQEAVKRLRERRDLLDDALNLLTSTRQSFLLQSFIEALTRGGPNGLPRPIELHAHDPTRYVGDMLAWVHQATAGEREFLDTLFDVKSHKKRMVGEARDLKGDASEEEMLARQCLDKALEGLARPLKVRIQHTVKSQEGIIVTYRIANLVQFYLVTMQRTIGEQALLTLALQEIFDFAHNAFLETLAAQGRSLLRFLHPPEPDLAPPMTLRESSATLHEIMSVYDTSLVEDDDREADFSQILQAAVDPLVKMCQHMIDIWQKGSEWEKNIFMVNCGLYLQHVLESYTFTNQRQAELQQQIDGWVLALKQEHYQQLLEQSGLHQVVHALKGDSDTPLSRLPGAEPKAITQAMKSFDGFLTSLDILTSPRLSLLTSARIASDIHRFALENIARDYDKIYSAVMDKDNKYEFPSTLLSRNPEDVYMLLGIERVS